MIQPEALRKSEPWLWSPGAGTDVWEMFMACMKGDLDKVTRLVGKDPRLSGHYRLDAVRGHLFEKAGDDERAIAHYRAVAERTTSVPERNYLMSKAVRLLAKQPDA